MSQQFFATTARYLEPLLAAELRALAVADIKTTRAGAYFTADLISAYRVCLWSRLANRVLLPLAHFPVPTAAALYAGTAALDWSTHFTAAQTFAVHVEGTSAALNNSHFTALTIKDAIVDQFRHYDGERPSVALQRPDVRIYGHVWREQIRLYVDLSGESLHRRGYREQVSAASLKETLAAALLLRAGWPQIAASGGALLDPMCGAGTLVIEAALIAADSAPGWQRDYWGFDGWRQHDATAWQQLLTDASARRQRGLAQLAAGGSVTGYDVNPAAIRAALGNLARAELTGYVHFECRELGDCRPRRAGESGLLVINPPYGERLHADGELTAVYTRLGQVLQHQFSGWQVALLTPRLELTQRWNWQPSPLQRVFNGPLECHLLGGTVTAAPASPAPALASPPVERSAGAVMFANRLRKNQRNLATWLRQEQISCYRLYDADLPDYALALDIYTTVATDTAASQRIAHVQEYAAPASIDPQVAQRRLHEALAVIADELELPPDALVYKQRQRQRGTAQYSRLAERQQWLTVAEDQLQLLINVHDYLDTGLFLDQRLTRRLVAQRAAGGRLLNLFGYTGTASCHAAAQGAVTTTVDLSRTYCDWTRRNLALNGFDTPPHRVVQADCLEWLREARHQRQQFEVIFLDPPTFSSSKRMTATFDVQRDHVAVIQAAVALLAPAGELFFCTNRRGFQLDHAALANWQPEDITRRTIPRDFARTPRVHCCWRLTAQ